MVPEHQGEHESQWAAIGSIAGVCSLTQVDWTFAYDRSRCWMEIRLSGW
jgi:hypothetical protein